MDKAISNLLPYIVNNNDSGIIVLNNELKSVLINDWIIKHANLTKNKLLNQDIISLFPKIKDQRLHTVIDEAIKLGRSSLLSQALHKSPLPLYQDSIIHGTKKLMLQRITIKPIKQNEQTYCLIQVFDLSAAVERENLLKATAKKAKISKEQAESLSKIKTEFVSTISHELRTPLTSITGSVGLILGGATGNISTETTAMLEIVHRNSNRLLKLINELLDIQKIESGTVEYNFKSTKLTPIISNCIEMNNAYADKFDIKYNFISSKGDFNVYIDQERISQVILNLLSNATKFSEKNSTITIKTEQTAKNVRIIFTDNGPGIPESFKNKIFTKFAQVNSEDNRMYAGSGLGLCICKSIIEHHNGKIDFYNNSKGATFYFDLPLEKTKHPSNITHN